MKTIPFRGQDYESLRKSCNPKKLFIDPIFKTNMESIGYTNEFCGKFQNMGGIRWMRPHVIFQMH